MKLEESTVTSKCLTVWIVLALLAPAFTGRAEKALGGETGGDALAHLAALYADALSGVETARMETANMALQIPGDEGRHLMVAIAETQVKAAERKLQLIRQAVAILAKEMELDKAVARAEVDSLAEARKDEKQRLQAKLTLLDEKAQFIRALLELKPAGSEGVSGEVQKVAEKIRNRQAGEATSLQCQNNLKEIAKMGIIYADSSGTRSFPHSPKGGIASIQVLVEFFGDIRPNLFHCPVSKAPPQAVDSEGKFTLTSENCSYEMAARKLSPVDSGQPLAWCRHVHEGGKRMVAFTDCSIQAIKAEDFEPLVKEKAKRKDR